MSGFHDMHCHLDFIEGAEDVAAEAREAGSLLYANTVTPEGWIAARERFAPFDNVRVGFGMHPWWAAGEPTEPDSAPRQASQRAARRQEEAAALSRRELTEDEQARIAATLGLLEEHDPVFIGEIGLDFGWRHQQSRLAQERMFEQISAWAGTRGGKVLSIHSIKAARETIEVLDRTGALDTCSCIFHWFSGPSDLLKSAIDAGCFFSCGLRMLGTGKGREYVKAIPAERLLLETDAPAQRGMHLRYADLRCDLEAAAAAIADIKGPRALQAMSDAAEALLER